MNDHNSNYAKQGQTGPKLQLDQIALRIGESVQLQIGNKLFFVALVGYLKDRGLIVATPCENGAPVQLDEGAQLLVRISVDKCNHAFDTTVCHVAKTPFPHLHLTYPSEVRPLKERQYDRIGVNIAGAADAPDGASLPCVVRDISIGGALIALNNQTGAVSDPLLLTLRVVINGVEYELSLNSEIRSVRTGSSLEYDDSVVLQGLAFNDLSEEDILALAAFDLLPDLNSAT